MKLASNFFKFVDIISPQITLKFKNSNRIQSVLGGFLTLVLIMVGSSGFAYFSRDTFFRINPITKQNSLSADEKVLPFENYPLAVVLLDNSIRAIEPGNPLYDSVELIPQFYFSLMEENVSTMKIGNLSTMPCSKEYFGKFKDNYGAAVNSGSTCVDYSQMYNLDGSLSNLDPSLYRRKFTSEEGLIDIKLKLCDEEKNPGCTKPFFEEGQIHVCAYILNEIVNFEDYSSPIEQQIDYICSTVSPGLFSRKHIKVASNRLITDDGYILTNTSSAEFMTTTLFDTQMASYSPVTRELYAFQLTVSINESVFERRYVKIQEILANIGGFVRLLMFIASFLTRHYSLYSFYMDFGEEINAMHKEAKQIRQETKVNYLVKPSCESSDKSNTVFTCALSKKTASVDTEMGFVQFFKSLLSKDKKKSKSYSLFKFLDVSYLTRKMIDLENKN